MSLGPDGKDPVRWFPAVSWDREGKPVACVYEAVGMLLDITDEGADRTLYLQPAFVVDSDTDPHPDEPPVILMAWALDEERAAETALYVVEMVAHKQMRETGPAPFYRFDDVDADTKGKGEGNG